MRQPRGRGPAGGWPIESFYDVDPKTGCWVWNGARKVAGYGSIRRDGRAWIAHRLLWTIHRGPIPEGMQVNHHCDNPPCVNPGHLFLGTQSDNMVDACRKRRVNAPGIAKGQPARNALKTACKRGHPFTAENTLISVRDGRGKRNCRTCMAESKRRSLARNPPRQRDPEKLRESSRRYYLANRERILARQREWKQKARSTTGRYDA